MAVACANFRRIRNRVRLMTGTVMRLQAIGPWDASDQEVSDGRRRANRSVEGTEEAGYRVMKTTHDPATGNGRLYISGMDVEEGIVCLKAVRAMVGGRSLDDRTAEFVGMRVQPIGTRNHYQGHEGCCCEQTERRLAHDLSH